MTDENPYTAPAAMAQESASAPGPSMVRAVLLAPVVVLPTNAVVAVVMSLSSGPPGLDQAVSVALFLSLFGLPIAYLSTVSVGVACHLMLRGVGLNQPIYHALCGLLISAGVVVVVTGGVELSVLAMICPSGATVGYAFGQLMQASPPRAPDSPVAAEPCARG
jgi:hypothetical protein